MPGRVLPIAALGCLALAMVFWFPDRSISAETVKPAAAERASSAEDSLNPLLDLARAKRKNEDKLRAALEKPVTIAFEEIPLPDAMRRIADVAGVNILVDFQALSEEGITARKTVSCSAQGETLYRLLKSILEPLDLSFEIRSEVIMVTTAIAADDYPVTRYYDVEDLLKWEEAHRFERRASSNTLIQTNRPHDWLLDTIESQTSGPWVDVDGTGGQLAIHGSLLSVMQTEDIHREIPAILRMFRLFSEDKFGKDKSIFLETLRHGNRDLAARRALAKRVTWNFEKTPLQEVVEQLSKELKLPITLDRQALTEEGVHVLTPITLSVKNVTLESAMWLMLDPLGLQLLTFEGTLRVTTMIAADEILHTVAYDVRDLLREGAISQEFFLTQLWAETPGPWVDLDGTGGSVSEPLPGLLLIMQTESCQREIIAFIDDIREREKQRKAKGLPPNFAAPVPNADDVLTEFYVIHSESKPPQVKKAIYDLVEPGTWEKQGGPGRIRIINNMLAVKNTAKVHRQVNAFLLRISTTWDKTYSWNQ